MLQTEWFYLKCAILFRKRYWYANADMSASIQGSLWEWNQALIEKHEYSWLYSFLVFMHLALVVAFLAVGHLSSGTIKQFGWWLVVLVLCLGLDGAPVIITPKEKKSFFKASKYTDNNQTELSSQTQLLKCKKKILETF